MKTRFGLVGLTNLFIVLAVVFTLFLTGNPLALLALVLLRDSPVMPYEAVDPNEETEADAQSIGFIDTNDS